MLTACFISVQVEEEDAGDVRGPSELLAQNCDHVRQTLPQVGTCGPWALAPSSFVVVSNASNKRQHHTLELPSPILSLSPSGFSLARSGGACGGGGGVIESHAVSSFVARVGVSQQGPDPCSRCN